MPDWEYGKAYERFPCRGGTVCLEDGSRLRVHDIFDPLPAFMRRADLIFTDSPWNTGNLRSFYTKAEQLTDRDFPAFMARLFDCIREIRPKVCYLEIGKEYLADYIMEMRKIYRYVTFYNSGYYHRKGAYCYIVRGSDRAKKPRLDGMDEEDAINWICANEDYTCAGDLCMGRGLVGLAAASAGKPFVGTELNHKRLSVLLERLGRSYEIKEDTP